MSFHWVSYMQLVLFCLPAHYIKSNILENIKLREKSNVAGNKNNPCKGSAGRLTRRLVQNFGLNGSKSSGKHPKNTSKPWQPQQGTLTQGGINRGFYPGSSPGHGWMVFLQLRTWQDIIADQSKITYSSELHHFVEKSGV